MQPYSETQKIREQDLTEESRRKIKPLVIGSRYGMLEVTGFAYLQERAYWHCLCKCGETLPVSRHALIRGNTRSCGCLRKTSRRSQRQGRGALRLLPQ